MLVGHIHRIDQTTGETAVLEVVLVDAERARDVTNAWRTDPTAGSANGAEFHWAAVSTFWPQRQVLAVMNQQVTCAMMQVDEDYVPAPKVVYISFLEVAPAERAGISRRRFIGLGTALMRFAIVRSQQLGFDGRVGLHSTSRAQPFYGKLGFKVAEGPTNTGKLTLNFCLTGPNCSWTTL